MLVYEYMPQGPLSLHLFEWAAAGLRPLEWKQRLSFALDVARGVEYLHSLARTSFIHRDLKPSNILLGDDMRAKVYNYVRIRQQMRQQAHESGDSPAIPITVRQLEAIIRLSESIAKMQLSTVATEEHVTEALRLFNVSTMDAARSGIAEQISLTPEMRSEIQQVETQIKRRMGIGINVSERRLIDDMVRMGLNESTVRRALLIMHQRDGVEYKRERRVIVRKV